MHAHTRVHTSVPRTHHDTGVLWAANNAREYGARCIVTRKAGLAHTGTVIHHQGLALLGLHGQAGVGK